MTEGIRSAGEAGREQSPKRSREPLYLRMYFQQHLTDLVRLFGYREVPIDEAREKLKPLNETYGLDIMKVAVEEIICIDNGSDPPVARLTDHARKLAVGILGSRPRHLATIGASTSGINADKAVRTRDGVPPSVLSDADHESAEPPPIPRRSATTERREKQCDSNAASDVAPESSEPMYEGPVRKRRRVVITAFEQWLKGTEQPFVAIDTAGQSVGTLNFVLQTKPLRQLVTIHNQMTKRQAREMREWRQKYGDQFEAYSVWPHEGPSGWEWIFTAIAR